LYTHLPGYCRHTHIYCTHIFIANTYLLYAQIYCTHICQMDNRAENLRMQRACQYANGQMKGCFAVENGGWRCLCCPKPRNSKNGYLIATPTAFGGAENFEASHLLNQEHLDNMASWGRGNLWTLQYVRRILKSDGVD
jgi:hypothetical protein